MKAHVPALAAGIAVLAQASAAWSDEDRDDRDHRYYSSCSAGALAGEWAFATDVGHETATFGNDITAIGTFDIGRDGTISGVFDVTFENSVFVPNVTFSGTITVNEDCRGTVSFITSNGASRTDSIMVLSRYEIWGMSQDPANLWTYRVRRLPR